MAVGLRSSHLGNFSLLYSVRFFYPPTSWLYRLLSVVICIRLESSYGRLFVLARFGRHLFVPFCFAVFLCFIILFCSYAVTRHNCWGLVHEFI